MKMNYNENENEDDDDDNGDSGSIVTSRSQLQFQRSKKSYLIKIYSARYLNHSFAMYLSVEMLAKSFTFNKQTTEYSSTLHIMKSFVFRIRMFKVYSTLCKSLYFERLPDMMFINLLPPIALQ